MSRRNPMRDEIAIVGLGSTDFSRDSGGTSAAGLAAEACINAIRDAGIDKSEIDGVVGALEPGAPRANEMSTAQGHHSSFESYARGGLWSRRCDDRNFLWPVRHGPAVFRVHARALELSFRSKGPFP